MPRPRLVHVFSTFAAGGPQVRTTDLLNAMGEEFTHVVVAMDRNFEAAARFDRAVRAETRAPPGLPGGLRNVSVLAEFLRGLAPDLLLTYNWGAIESVPAARSIGVARTIHAEDGFGPEEAERLLRRRNWARRIWLRRVSRVVVPSRQLERIARGTWWLADRVRYVPNGIDTERFHVGDRLAARRLLGRGERGPVLGTVAKLRAEKNLCLLLRAFAVLRRDVPDAALWIAGDGPLRDELAQTSRELELGSSVWFAGQLRDPAEFYRALDVFALSSRTEQMPLSVTEAMASGLSIVSTDVGDVAEMIDPAQRALVVGSQEVEAFAAALHTALRAGDRVRWGVLNRQRCVERYSFATMLRSYRALYAGVL